MSELHFTRESVSDLQAVLPGVGRRIATDWLTMYDAIAAYAAARKALGNPKTGVNLSAMPDVERAEAALMRLVEQSK